jgi:hypothetical protein
LLGSLSGGLSFGFGEVESIVCLLAVTQSIRRFLFKVIGYRLTLD